MPTKTPRRGDVWATTAPRDARGHEQAGARYAVIVSADAYSALSTIAAVPTSTRSPHALIHPEIIVKGAPTRVLIDQLRCIDKQRLGRKVGRLSLDELAEIEVALKAYLGLL